MQPRQIISLGNFFSAAHFFLIIYVVAPYLALFLPESATGLVISAGAVMTLVAFPFMPRLVRRYGAKRLAISLAFLQAVTLSVLAGNPSLIFGVVAVALACAISPLIAYQLDLLLEATVAEEGSTGRVRTAFLTAGSAALVLAPLLVGFLLDGTDRYDYVFLAAAISLTPFIMLFLVEHLPEGTPPRRERLAATFTCIRKDRDLRAVAIAGGALQLFFHFAPLYIPLYLHIALGMPWDQLGWMFAVAMLPYLFVEFPAGWLADRYLGDRKLLLAGFVLMGASFSAFAFVTAATPVFVILILLIGSRIGAALAEAMIEGHFFRRITERDASTIAVFRMMRPGGALIAPVAGSFILLVGNYSMLFFFTGIGVTLIGVYAVRSMQEVVRVSDMPLFASRPVPQLQVSEG